MTAMRGTLAEMELERDPLVPVPPPGQDQLPCDDGVPMETIRHREQMNLLIDTLRVHWNDREEFFVGGNMFVYFSELQTRQNDFRGPDVFVALGVDRWKQRKSWVAWEEGGKLPDVVIELLSDSTQKVDRGEKKRIYERIWKVGTYVLYDPLSLELEGYARGPDGAFARLEPSPSGDLFIAELGLSVGVRPLPFHDDPGPFLRWLDGEVVILTEEERTKSVQARADEQKARADEAQARADEAQARADEAQARADEAQARTGEVLEAARARIAALEAELARRA